MIHLEHALKNEEVFRSKKLLFCEQVITMFFRSKWKVWIPQCLQISSFFFKKGELDRRKEVKKYVDFFQLPKLLESIAFHTCAISLLYFKLFQIRYYQNCFQFQTTIRQCSRVHGREITVGSKLIRGAM